MIYRVLLNKNSFLKSEEVFHNQPKDNLSLIMNIEIKYKVNVGMYEKFKLSEYLKNFEIF
jgi:hypothetical protein